MRFYVYVRQFIFIFFIVRKSCDIYSQNCKENVWDKLWDKKLQLPFLFFYSRVETSSHNISTLFMFNFFLFCASKLNLFLRPFYTVTIFMTIKSFSSSSHYPYLSGCFHFYIKIFVISQVNEILRFHKVAMLCKLVWFVWKKQKKSKHEALPLKKTITGALADCMKTYEWDESPILQNVK